ncbi:MAG: hypothetical protein M3O50_15655 [Myxococcota bacterium]|nr:hypothetical protein [Myxococcota bacterium]
MQPNRALPLLAAMLVGIAIYFASAGDARAIPSFARKYQTSCQTCHTVYPTLNPFGEAFRRDGYRFPSQNGSVDSDAVKASTIALGQEESIKTFPDSVWPDKIAEAVPLSAMFNGRIPINLPNSEARNQAGNTFTWTGVQAELHLFGAGAFNDTLTYLTQLTLASSGGLDIETGYLLWNDIVGPRHLVNLWVGRLFAPQLTSFGLHSAYLSDTVMPAVSVAGLYNPGAGFTLGSGHTDGAELNGIVAHRLNYALGWVASSSSPGLKVPNAEDVYAHVGIKSGGVALDGEGKYGPNVPDPRKPWAERAITLDVFAYHGIARLDNGTGVSSGTAPTPTPQDDRFNAVGGVVHGQWDSLLVTAGAQFERHERPYPGTAALSPAIPGQPTRVSGSAMVQYDEIDYVVWPWFVPGVRAEYTRAAVESAADSQLLRIIPGVAMLVRPNIKVVLTGDLEWGQNLPPVGAWTAAGGAVVPNQTSKFEAEQINATLAVAY